jgi:hypothetical protein
MVNNVMDTCISSDKLDVFLGSTTVDSEKIMEESLADIVEAK